MTVDFIKMQGLGNDYIYVDGMVNRPTFDFSDTAKRISDRHFGIGGDGLVLILPSSEADCMMRMFNADGSEGRMCGNAIRCVGKYIYEAGYVTSHEITVETLSGIKKLLLSVDKGIVTTVSVDMGEPSFTPSEIPIKADTPFVDSKIILSNGTEYIATALSMGNPHVVVLMERIADFPLHEIGPLLENHPMFPDRVNAEFVEKFSDTHIAMRVWERGSGETLACGTGACASVAALVKIGLLSYDVPVVVSLLGGDLTIEYSKSGRIWMTGPATEVFRGRISI